MPELKVRAEPVTDTDVERLAGLPYLFGSKPEALLVAAVDSECQDLEWTVFQPSLALPMLFKSSSDSMRRPLAEVMYDELRKLFVK